MTGGLRVFQILKNKLLNSIQTWAIPQQPTQWLICSSFSVYHWLLTLRTSQQKKKYFEWIFSQQSQGYQVPHPLFCFNCLIINNLNGNDTVLLKINDFQGNDGFTLLMSEIPG